MTVRLIAAIALADLLSHIGEFYSAWNGGLEFSSSLCHSVIGFRLFARTFYAFTNLAIGFHLYRSLVQIKKSTWKFEIATWIVVAVMTAVFTLIYWGLGAFSGVERKKACSPGADDKTLNSVFYAIAGLVDLATIISGIFITVTGHRNLNKWINAYSATLAPSENDHEQLIKDRRKMAARSFLYPLSACITLPIECIFLFLNAGNVYVSVLTILMALTIGISGLLTGLAFAIDPATQKSFKSAYRTLKYRNSDKKYSEEFNM
ncbi:hypothetical protein CONCODRAFT_77220, partial [Conidiobolus coronatus NRRL 28638]